MVFPQTPLDVDVELQIGGTWTDITPDVYTRAPIAIEYGRSEESVRTNPGKCSLQFNNRLGKYSPRNPMSPYYDLIGRNTPVRVSVNAGDSYLAVTGQNNAGASTPDHASLDITGDIDIRFDATLDNWVTAGLAPSVDLCGKFTTVADQRSWFLQQRDGKIHFEWSPDGTTILQADSTELPVLPVSRRMAWRVTLDVNNGAGGWTASFYTAPTIAGPWTQLGDAVVTAGTTSIFNSSAPLKAGDATNFAFAKPIGQVHAFELRNGINGPVVASPDFTAQTPGAGSFTDAAGRVWTVAANSTLSNRQVLFSGEISAWPARWDLSGEDVWVPVEAAGVLRRYGQGKKALASTLRRRIPSYSPLAYWPCEDADGAVQAYSPIEGVAPLAVTGFTFAQDDGLAGSDALPSVAAGGKMRGTVPAQTSGTGWMVEMVYNVSAAPGSDQEFLSFRGDGTIKRWRVLMRNGIATLLGLDFENIGQVNSSIAIGADVFEGWQRVQLRAIQLSPGVLEWTLTWYNIGGVSGEVTDTTFADIGQVTQIDTTFGTQADLRVGHVSVFPFGDASNATLPYLGADTGFTGETASERLERLTAEESSTLSLVVADSRPKSLTEAMGPQRPDTLLDLLQECADTDGGILYEARDTASLIYRSRSTLYNQAPALVLDYTAEGEVGPPLEPIEDDQRTRNDVTVSRSGGSSGRAVLESGPLSVQAPPDGVGLYDEALTLSLGSDAQTVPIAYWRLHLGTWDEARYPTVRVMLHAAPHLITAATALNIGDRIQIINTPPWLPPGPIDLVVQGVAQVVDQFTWDMVFTCTPGGPWTVGVLGDAALGRLDTTACELGSGIDADDTSLTLVTIIGPRWIDSAGYASQFPFDVLVDGELVTITGITGTTTTQTATGVRSQNGIVKAHPAGARVRLAQPIRLAL